MEHGTPGGRMERRGSAYMPQKRTTGLRRELTYSWPRMGDDSRYFAALAKQDLNRTRV
jgi:hypothetical protein